MLFRSGNTYAADFPDDELLPGLIGLSGFAEFIKSRGIILTHAADGFGLQILFNYFDAGAVLSPETILEILTKFNPARQPAEVLA